MIKVNGITFEISGTKTLSNIDRGTPFLYKEKVCLPHARYSLTRCTDFFTGEEYSIDDFYITVPLLVVKPGDAGTSDTALTEKIKALEERVDDLEKIVKMMLRNS